MTRAGGSRRVPSLWWLVILAIALVVAGTVAVVVAGALNPDYGQEPFPSALTGGGGR